MALQQFRLTCGNTVFTHYYLALYFPLATGEDLLSYSLVRFKQRLQPDLDAWIDCAGDLLGRLSFPPQTIVLRALRHEETTVRPEFPSALDRLGQSLALRFGCRYRPDLLSKTRATLPGKYLTREERELQLRDAYRLAATVGAAVNPHTQLLLIDDILTTGSTMRAIIRSVREQLPDCPIHIFTLSRAKYHAPAPLPVEGGEPVSEYACEGKNYTAEGLKMRIIANTV